MIFLEIDVPKYMPTSVVDADVHPQYVRVDIKDKITQLVWPKEIIVEKSKCERSEITGVLKFTCKTVETSYKNTPAYKAAKQKRLEQERLEEEK